MGAPIRSKAVYTGRNYDVGPWNDTHFIRCSRCGFINNLDREIHSNDGSYEGWGTTFSVVTTTSAGSGFGTHSPVNAGLQTNVQGLILYSTSVAATDTLVNGSSVFSFNTTKTSAGNQILINGTSTGGYGVMLLLWNGGIYAINNSNQWSQYVNNAFSNIAGDPRTLQYLQTSLLPLGLDLVANPVYDSTMDAVVGAGCSQCGTLLYTR